MKTLATFNSKQIQIQCSIQKMQLALSDPVELPPLQIINIAAVMQPPAIFRELTIANDVWMKHTNFWTVFFS